jgi:hypothetical protein
MQRSRWEDSRPARRAFLQCGRRHGAQCLHDEIAKAFPELAKYIKWHLCSTDGPMHYVANTVFHADEHGPTHAWVYFTGQADPLGIGDAGDLHRRFRWKRGLHSIHDGGRQAEHGLLRLLRASKGSAVGGRGCSNHLYRMPYSASADRTPIKKSVAGTMTAV